LKNNSLIILFLLCPLFVLQGCAPVVVAGAAAGASVANDRRTAGTVLEDQSIELKAGSAIQADEALSKSVHISVTSFNNIVLLTGQAPTRALREQVLEHVRSIDKVKGIHDEISVEDPTSFNTRSNDTWITTKCKSTLLGAKGLDATHVKVVTEDGVVYLMGLVTREEGNTAAKTVQQVTGVQKVVKVFEYID
jgi:osmotically-inducible protein OsmY